MTDYIAASSSVIYLSPIFQSESETGKQKNAPPTHKRNSQLLTMFGPHVHADFTHRTGVRGLHWLQKEELLAAACGLRLEPQIQTLHSSEHLKI